MYVLTMKTISVQLSETEASMLAGLSAYLGCAGRGRGSVALSRILRAAHAELGLDPALDGIASVAEGPPGVDACPPDRALLKVREALALPEPDRSALGVQVGAKGRTREVWVNVPRLFDALGGRVSTSALRTWCKERALGERGAGSRQRADASGTNLRWYVVDMHKVR